MKNILARSAAVAFLSAVVIVPLGGVAHAGTKHDSSDRDKHSSKDCDKHSQHDNGRENGHDKDADKRLDKHDDEFDIAKLLKAFSNGKYGSHGNSYGKNENPGLIGSFL